MSIPAVKGVEVGLGFGAARRSGAEVHDEIAPAPGRAGAGNVRRATNRAGGLEGGITTGEPLVLRAAMKPISTLMRPLGTVDVRTGEAASAAAERSDVTAVPAMGVIAEAMTAFVLAQALLEKCGGDSLGEVRRNLAGYVARVAERVAAPGAGAPGAGAPAVAADGTRRARDAPSRAAGRRRRCWGRGRPAPRRPRRAPRGGEDHGRAARRRAARAPLRRLRRRARPTHRAVDRGAVRRRGGGRLPGARGRAERRARRRRAGGDGARARAAGWATNVAARLALATAGRTVYLRVRAETAARRLAADPVVRPLVAGAADPARTVAALLARRGAYYEAADAVVDADAGTPEAVADAVVRAIRQWDGAAGAVADRPAGAPGHRPDAARG
jgi:hypothetical protein